MLYTSVTAMSEVCAMSQVPCLRCEFTTLAQVEFSAADISGGLEVVPVSVCNEQSPGSLPRKFVYRTSNVIHKDLDLHLISSVTKRISRTPCVYTAAGCLKPSFMKRFSRNSKSPLFIKECWGACDCASPCINRVVQRGLVREVQVFWTGSEKEWGIRALKDLPMGCFVFEFIGEIVTTAEMEKRVVQALTDSEEPYIQNVVLDADWHLEKEIDDSRALCLDGTFLGNVTRYINHRCWDANLVDVPVSIEYDTRHYYHVCPLPPTLRVL